MNPQKPIALFDSGIGGLSILLEIKKIMPNETTIFFADQKNIPFGKKSKKELKVITTKIASFLIKHDAKMLVVACNTATCYALDHLRANFKIPIVGTVPSIKPASTLTRKSKIAILSSRGTAKSSYLNSLITRFAEKNSFLKVECSGLEEAIESLNWQKIDKYLKIYAKKVNYFGADVIVLGCTHYPLVKDMLTRHLDNSTIVIDSGLPVAKRVQKVLQNFNILAREKTEKDLYFTTANADIFSKVSSQVLKKDISAIHVKL